VKITSNIEQFSKEKTTKPHIKKYKTLVIVLPVFLIIMSMFRSFDFFDYLKLKGVQGPSFRASPTEYLSAIATELPSAVITPSELEELKIDIKFKDWQKLSEFRDTAMFNEIISINEKDYVDANITFKGKQIKSKLRLKGDWTDHLRGNKWSFRVKLKGEKYIDGISKFSIQSPAVRDFQGQFLIDKMLHEYKILAPRYFLVNVNINGDDIGVMALYEHFSKELLENSKRKESVIIKFDEAALWKSRSKNKIYDVDEYTAKIIPFELNKIKSNPNLYRDYQVAVGLIRGFLKGELKAHDVFDAKLMGDFLAINDLWGESHGFIWHNLRFYYNPVSAKLEPIGFDQMLYHNPNTLDLAPDSIADTKFLKQIREDGFIKLIYIETLKELENKFQDEKYLNQYVGLDRDYENLLRKEFFFKPPPLLKNNNLIHRLNLLISKATETVVHVSSKKNNLGWVVNASDVSQSVEIYLNGVKEKANLFVGEFYKYGLSNLGLKTAFHGYKNIENQDKTTNSEPVKDDIIFLNQNIDLSKYQQIANLYYYNNSDKGTLIEIQNLIPSSLEIKGAKLFFKEYMNLKPKDIKINGFIQASESKFEQLSEVNYSDIHKIVLSLQIPGGNDVLTMDFEKYAMALSENPIPQQTVSSLLKNHHYLSLNNHKKEIIINPGNWLVNSPLIVPAGYTLKASKGTLLEFSSDSYILSHGNLSFIGTLDNPIILKPKNNNSLWKGVTILGNYEYPKSILKYVNISGITGLKSKDWIVDAGLFVYQSDLFLENIEIKNNNSEDAINIVSSKFTIKDIVIKNSTIDGLDVDFSNGKIIGGVFSNIGYKGGGDAIDFSGSYSELEKLKISDIYDKGISIGEKSNILAENIDLSNLAIGVAIKDGSSLIMNNSSIHNAGIGISAYIKKKEYSPPLAKINNTVIKSTKENALSDQDSTIYIDGIMIDHLISN
jgi:hypothetical protein